MEKKEQDTLELDTSKGSANKGDSDGNESESENDSEKSFTQEEMNQVVGKEKLQLKEKLQRDFEEKIAKKVEEARQKTLEEVKMTEEERKQKWLEEQQKEIEESKRENAIEKNKLRVIKRLVKANILDGDEELEQLLNEEMVNLLATEDVEVTKARIESFVKNFDNKVASGVENKLKGNPPKDPASNSDENTSNTTKNKHSLNKSKDGFYI